MRRFSFLRTAPNQAPILSTLTTDSRVHVDQSIRGISRSLDTVLAKLAPEFDAVCAGAGRQSAPPETLLKATAVMALYLARTKRQFCKWPRFIAGLP